MRESGRSKNVRLFTERILWAMYLNLRKSPAVRESTETTV
jgi:hypothetical protein